MGTWLVSGRNTAERLCLSDSRLVEVSGRQRRPARGLLLHPSVGDMVNEAALIQNHEIRFATVGFGATANEIREQH